MNENTTDTKGPSIWLKQEQNETAYLCQSGSKWLWGLGLIWLLFQEIWANLWKNAICCFGKFMHVFRCLSSYLAVFRGVSSYFVSFGCLHGPSGRVWLITASDHIGSHRTTSNHVWPCLQRRYRNFQQQAKKRWNYLQGEQATRRAVSSLQVRPPQKPRLGLG